MSDDRSRRTCAKHTLMRDLLGPVLGGKVSEVRWHDLTAGDGVPSEPRDPEEDAQ